MSPKAKHTHTHTESRHPLTANTNSQLSSCMVHVWLSMGKFFRSMGQERMSVSLEEQRQHHCQEKTGKSEKMAARAAFPWNFYMPAHHLTKQILLTSAIVLISTHLIFKITWHLYFCLSFSFWYFSAGNMAPQSLKIGEHSLPAHKSSKHSIREDIPRFNGAPLPTSQYCFAQIKLEGRQLDTQMSNIRRREPTGVIHWRPVIKHLRGRRCQVLVDCG